MAEKKSKNITKINPKRIWDKFLYKQGDIKLVDTRKDKKK